VLQPEPGGAARRRVHGEPVGAPVAQGGDRGGGVLAGAHDQHPGVGPVRDARGGELEGEAHERTTRASDVRAVLDAAGRVRGLLEQPLEIGRRRAALTGALERAAHLARDLVFADDDRLEAGAHGEEVLDDLVARDDPHAVAEVVGRDVARVAHGRDRGLDRDGAAGGEGLVDVEVGLEAVAGREHDGAVDEVAAVDQGADRRGCADAQLLEEVEAGVPMGRRQADEHRSRVTLIGRSGWVMARCREDARGQGGLGNAPPVLRLATYGPADHALGPTTGES
jgi:hypothetical protein